MLTACPERIAGAVIVDPLGAHLEVMEEFGKNLQAGFDDATRRRLDEIEAREDAGHFPWLEFPDAMRASIDRLPA